MYLTVSHAKRLRQTVKTVGAPAAVCVWAATGVIRVDLRQVGAVG